MLCLPRCNALRFCIKESVCITLFVYILVYILLLSGKNHEASQKQDFPGQPICLVYIWAILGEKCRIKLKMGNNNHIWLVHSHLSKRFLPDSREYPFKGGACKARKSVIIDPYTCLPDSNNWNSIFRHSESQISDWNSISHHCGSRISDWNSISRHSENQISDWNSILTHCESQISKWNSIFAHCGSTISKWNYTFTHSESVISELLLSGKKLSSIKN